MTPEVRIAQLEAENATLREQVSELPVLREQVTVLLVRVQELEAPRAKDSHNSGKPPSSDGLRRKTKSLRTPSGKKAGGQLGHRGQTLYLLAGPDAVVEHRPAVCASCQTPLQGGELVVLRERRQVQELPPLRLQVIEQQALHLRCPSCGQGSAGTFPAETPSRAQYGPRLRALAVYLVPAQFVPFGRAQQLLHDLFGVRLARGTVVSWVQQAAQALLPVAAAIKAALAQAPVLHNDETGVRRGGRLAWAHVASTARLTHYAIHTQRGSDATEAIGILPGFRGVSVHDGWTGYRAYTACRHALCNVHHLRELTFSGGGVSPSLGPRPQGGPAADADGSRPGTRAGTASCGAHPARPGVHPLPGSACRRTGRQSPTQGAAPTGPAGTARPVTCPHLTRTAHPRPRAGTRLPG
jgi:transposase